MLDTRHLRVFAAVAEHGSMAKAADALAFTPSAVSQQVAALERQVDAPLLLRHARGVRLTELGTVLHRHAVDVLGRLERVEADLADRVALIAGRLRMATFGTGGSSVLPPAVAEFGRRYPAVALSVEVDEPEHTAARVRHGELDLALTFTYDHQPPPEGVTAHPLVEDPMLVALPAGHPARGDEPLAVARLRDEAWVRDGGTVCAEQLDRLCGAAGFAPRVVFESDDYVAVGRLVSSGTGLALVPGLVADQMPADVALVDTDPAVRRSISVVVAETPSPAAEAMLDVLRSVVEGRGHREGVADDRVDGSCRET